MARLITLIPPYNAAAGLPAVLEQLAEAHRIGVCAGLVVTDGGSRDDSAAIARRAGAHLVTGVQGRGAQLAAAAQAAGRLAGATDWYLFLHADTVLEPGWAGMVRAFMDKPENARRAGYFRFAVDDCSHRARRLERAVAWRCRMFALPYGDQGLLIRRDFYEALGGFKPFPLFEDVDLVRRIGRARLCALPVRAVTSAEKFRREGYSKRSAKNLVLLARYFLGESPERLAKAYR
jgi:rSAM/selenodomain-associated transferase 2